MMENSIVSPGLIAKVRAYVEEHMSHYDGSHDYHHILRVVGLAQHLYTHSQSPSETPTQTPPSSPPTQPLDPGIITLSALLHDISDRKYLSQDQTSPETQIESLLLSYGASATLASTIQTICSAVSYSFETKSPATIQAVLEQHPELAVVQDADRLDALGAVGVGRVFTYGAVRAGRDMGRCMEMLNGALYGREGRMKTMEGKRMARERVERLKMFEGWWEEEVRSDEHGLKILKELEGENV